MDLLKRLRYAGRFLRKDLVHLNLQILYKCNFTCKICDFWQPRWQGQGMLSLDQTRAIVEKLKPEGPFLISIGGGEPLLHPEILPIARELSRDNLVVMICNGWFMTRETARAIWEAGLYEVSISVDYLDPERHDTHRGRPGAHARALQALKYLHEERVHPHQRTHMISVVMDDNLDDIEPLAQLAAREGYTYLVTFHSTSRGRKEKRAAPAEVGRRLREIQKRNPSFVTLRGYVERFGEADENGEIGPCRAGINLLNVDCNGNVSTCIDRLDDSCGNILEDSFDDIRLQLARRQKESSCGSCWTSCRGPIESLMYGKDRLGNLLDLHRMTKDVPLVRSSP
ncbi:MAG: radical SAM protein [Fibrobacteria bacterium]|nr:radical SAM protein [Fibrobacteria bacterium]